MFPEEKQNTAGKVSKLVVNNLIKFILIGISFIYLFSGFFRPELSDVPFWVRIMGSIISIITAVMISSMLGSQGMITANKSEEVIKVKEDHTRIIEQANEYAEYSDAWSDEENKIAYKKARTHLLSSAGLKYSKFFDEDGELTGEKIEFPTASSNKKINKAELLQYYKRVRALNRAIYIKLSQVTFAGIATDSSVNYDYNNLGDTQTSFHTKRTLRKTLLKVLSVGILGSVSFQLIIGQGWQESLFNGAIQLALFFALGGWEYVVNYTFVTGEYIGSLKKKINLGKRMIAFGKSKRGEYYGRTDS